MRRLLGGVRRRRSPAERWALAIFNGTAVLLVCTVLLIAMTSCRPAEPRYNRTTELRQVPTVGCEDPTLLP